VYELSEQYEHRYLVRTVGEDHYVPRSAELPSERLAAETEIRRQIESAEWSSGDQIQSVTELAAAHGVSRATVVKDVRVLVDEGLLVTRQGWGTFVV
jgi:DNA-binding GntR family transcriptional regulator